MCLSKFYGGKEVRDGHVTAGISNLERRWRHVRRPRKFLSTVSKFKTALIHSYIIFLPFTRKNQTITAYFASRFNSRLCIPSGPSCLSSTMATTSISYVSLDLTVSIALKDSLQGLRPLCVPCTHAVLTSRKIGPFESSKQF